MNKATSESIASIKKNILLCCHDSGEGHIPSAFSILDILYVLYKDIMNLQINSVNSDKFILSKGHASLGLYGILESQGFISNDDLKTFGKYYSILGGHPDTNKIHGVEASTGSLGHGMPIAVGMALASKIKKIDNRIFCLVGDGECNEGTIWESILLASQHQLSNFCCIVDHNHSTDRALDMGDLASKFKSFGWTAIEANGHNHDELQEKLNLKTENPLAIICETVKGYGIKRMENEPAWHHRSPSKEELVEMLEELDEKTIS